MHKLTLVMSPDQKYEEDLQQKEYKQLQSMLDKLTDTDKKEVLQKGVLVRKKVLFTIFYGHSFIVTGGCFMYYIMLYILDL